MVQIHLGPLRSNFTNYICSPIIDTSFIICYILIMPTSENQPSDGQKDISQVKPGPSFSQMEALFQNLQGFHVRHDAIPINPEIKSVQMTWTEEQLSYVARTVKALVRLANEKSEIDINGKIERRPLLSQLIVEQFAHMVKTQESNISYSEVITRALIELYKRFGDNNPNLTPVMVAIFEVAGQAGTSLSIQQVKDSLAEVLNGELTKENMYQIPSFASKSSFVTEYDADEQELEPEEYDRELYGDEFERWCSGIPMAISTIQSARIAAVDISELVGIPATYTPNIESGYSFMSAAEDIKNQVMSSLDQAKQSQIN